MERVLIGKILYEFNIKKGYISEGIGRGSESVLMYFNKMMSSTGIYGLYNNKPTMFNKSNLETLRKRINQIVESKVMKIKEENVDYQSTYVFPLGVFLLKTDDGEYPLKFVRNDIRYEVISEASDLVYSTGGEKKQRTPMEKMRSQYRSTFDKYFDSFFVIVSLSTFQFIYMFDSKMESRAIRKMAYDVSIKYRKMSAEKFNYTTLGSAEDIIINFGHQQPNIIPI